MKNKRFLSITMVLLTALFVFAFAAVTKNTAVKANAVDGATAVADEIHGPGDVSTTRHRPSITAIMKAPTGFLPLLSGMIMHSFQDAEAMSPARLRSRRRLRASP